MSDLAGFPMVMAVSQDAINAQLAKVYGQSTHEPDMFPKVPWTLEGPEGAWSVTVEQFAAPEVDFDTDLEMGCRLKMTILKGRYTTWVFAGMVDGKPNMVHKDTPLDGLVMYVTTPMKQVKHDEWTDEMFEVQALFADLENMHKIELDLSENPQFAAMGVETTGLKSILGDRITAIGTADPHALVFGPVRIPSIGSAEQTTGSLKPTAVAFSTTVTKDHNDNYISGNLNYLLWLGDYRTIPEVKGGIGALSSLLRQNSQATAVISGSTVLEKIVKPVIEGDFPNISLTVDPGDYGTGVPAKMYQTEGETYSWGVTLNGRGRTAYLVSIDSTLVHDAIKVQYRIQTSVYGAFKDIHIDVTAYRLVSLVLEEEKLKVKVSPATTVNYSEDPLSPFSDFNGVATFGLNQSDDYSNALLESLNLPGNVVWRFSSVTLDGHQLYLTAAYE